MTKDDYILIESSENDADQGTKDAHPEDDGVSLRTMHDHGVFVETEENPTEGLSLNDASTRELLSQNGVEILPNQS